MHDRFISPLGSRRARRRGCAAGPGSVARRRPVHQRADRGDERRLLSARRRARQQHRQGHARREDLGAGDQGLGGEPQPAAAGRGEIAFTLGDSLSDAWKGNEEAGFKTPLNKLRGVAAIYPNYIQIVARADAGIKTLADLKGKKISVGAPKSGTELNARDDPEGRGPDLRGLRQGRVPAVRRIGRADEEPAARRHAAVGGPRRRLPARPRDVDRHRRRARSRRRREEGRRPGLPRRPRFPPIPTRARPRTCRRPPCRTTSSRTMASASTPSTA